MKTNECDNSGTKDSNLNLVLPVYVMYFLEIQYSAVRNNIVQVKAITVYRLTVYKNYQDDVL